MKRKTALITGWGGQDAWYLGRLLLQRGYRVVGGVRRPPTPQADTGNSPVELQHLDLLDFDSVKGVLGRCRPDEIYNLAALSHIPSSWEAPTLTAQCNGLGFARLLEAVRRSRREVRVFQASSGAMYGPGSGSPIHESSPFDPRTPYGVSKTLAHGLAVVYREAHGMFISCGILFNHESPRRSPRFVSRKISQAAAMISRGRAKELALGDLEAVRDWGFAGDYVEGMWRALQNETAEDFVFATGKLHSVRDLVEAAFSRVGLNWRDHVRIDPRLFGADRAGRAGDASKARRLLGWRPRVGFKALVELMVDADLSELEPRTLGQGSGPA